MAFHEQLTDKLTKERGGRHGGKGHEFHRYWALCHLLQVDLAQNDYVLLIEFIEDVAVLNAEHTPTALDLFQLKKKDGGANWTKAKLSKPQKDSPSVLAKLFESQKAVPHGNAAIAFVSNAPVSLSLASELDSTQQAEFSAADLADSLKTELQAAIATELACTPEEIKLDTLRFIQTPLALNDLETHANGRVATYLAQKFPEHSARADVFCKALYAELTVRATNTQEVSSFADLCKMRGIGKSQFNEMLAITLSRKPASEVMDAAVNSLTQEGVSFTERSGIKAAGRRYIVERIGQTNLALTALEQQIAFHRGNLPSHLITSWQVTNWIYEQLRQSNDWHYFAALNKPYVLAAILYWINQ
jgi:hypothetical protein